VTVRLMSDRELSRLEALRDLDQKRLTTAAAGQLLGLERRQVFRLLKAYRTEGTTGLISKAPRPPQQPTQARGAAASGVGDHSRVVLGFGPTLAAEKLREVHGIALDRETRFSGKKPSSRRGRVRSLTRKRRAATSYRRRSSGDDGQK
jgi:hypothetical protein